MDLLIPKSIRYVFEELLLSDNLMDKSKNQVLDKLGNLKALSITEKFYFKQLFGVEYSDNWVLEAVDNYASSISVPSIKTLNKERWYKFIFPRENKKQQLWFWVKRLKASKENIKKTNTVNKFIKQQDIDLFIDGLLQEDICTQAARMTNCFSSLDAYRKAVHFNLSPTILPFLNGYNKLCKYGWYSKNNILGMTKDHRLSVHYGYYNRIPPYILAHPANCEFMSLKQNSSKNYKSSCSLEELYQDIKLINTLI